MPKFQIQTRMYGGEWECPEEFPTTYSSYQEASEELEDFINDCVEAVNLGHLTDFNPLSWKIFEIVGADQAEAIKGMAQAFELLIPHQEIHAVREALTLIDQSMKLLEGNYVGQH